MAPEHGELDSQSPQTRWFCGYWMTQEEWENIHDYAPPNVHVDAQKEQEKIAAEERQGEEEEE